MLNFYSNEVNFNTMHVDTESVLAKESHSLLKHSLKLQYARKKHVPKVQKYDLTKLILMNVPADVDEEYFQLYLSYQLKMDIKEFCIEQVGDIAIITFTRDFLVTRESMIIYWL